jgi:microcystin-dependent protein
MGQPYVGEIRIFGGNFPPAGWMFCEGQTLPISENETLFQLIGTTYGGDGQETFNLPDLRGRVPVHQGQGPSGTTYIIGEQGGVESVTLTTNQMPNHSHALTVSGDQGGQTDPTNQVVGSNPTVQLFRPGAATVPFNADTATPVGGSGPHENRQPFVAIHYIIALFGIFPSPT